MCVVCVAAGLWGGVVLVFGCVCVLFWWRCAHWWSVAVSKCVVSWSVCFIVGRISQGRAWWVAGEQVVVAFVLCCVLHCSCVVRAVLDCSTVCFLLALAQQLSVSTSW